MKELFKSILEIVVKSNNVTAENKKLHEEIAALRSEK